MIDFKDNDIVFYIKKSDWRNEAHACLFKDFKQDSMEIIDADYDNIEEVFHYSIKDISKWDTDRVSVYKDKPNTTYNVLWTDVDPRIMTLADTKKDIEQREINLKDMISQGRAPGLVTSVKDTNRGSVTHKGKIDEGAMEDLLVKSLPKAVDRAKERQNTIGHSFTKNDTNKTILRRKK